MNSRAVAALVSIALAGAALAQSALHRAGDAFGQPRRGLSAAQQQAFWNGRSLFRQPWTSGASSEHPEFTGLGPLYNRLSCIACHVKNGRGEAAKGGEIARHMVVRLSLDGHDAHGGPVPEPSYGGQLNPEGIVGVAGEGWAVLNYDTHTEILAGGEQVELRRPRLGFRDLAYGPLHPATRHSVRNAPPVFGLGLLAEVPEAALAAVAVENGGRLNHVWDFAAHRKAIGRFGLKANQPSLLQQNANAFVEDIGITSALFPRETCTDAQPACQAARRQGAAPELAAQQLADITLYLHELAAPPRRDAQDPLVVQGERLFNDIGCARCHRAHLPSQGGTIAPYTDLLLHDMGDGLADGRRDFEAGPRDWRTAPLWGIGLAGKVGDFANFLHDGRARTLTEAVLWHGGEAQAVADAFRRLPPPERSALLRFLDSL